MKSLTATFVLALAFASVGGCGTAQRAGRGAAEGVIGKLAEKVPERESLEQMTESLKRRAVGAAVDELSRQERLDEMARIAEALAAGTVSGATQAAAGPAIIDRAGERGAIDPPSPTPVERIAAQAARAFSQQLTAELGRTGEGPLATSLSATTEQMSASMARGAQGELAPLFPECQGAEASKCLDRAIERITRASSAGVAAGIRDSLGLWPLALAFGIGVFFTLLLAWAWEARRASRSAHA